MRPIDADKLDGRKLAVPDWLKPDERTRGWNECIEYVKKTAPTLDVAPVRHGKRTEYTVWHTSAWGEIYTKFECCGLNKQGRLKYNYCPNCGAKMRGDEDATE